MTPLKDSANQSFPHIYDDVNRLTSRSAPNGVTTSESYDDLDRLTGLTHSTSTATLISNQYQYNDANNISSWTNASGNHTYGYDLVDRLTSATNSAQPNESYSFDGVGNRTASHLSASYSYQPFNKLTSTASATYAYDNNGNLLSKSDAAGTTTFTWNEENQLKQVALPSGLTVNYKYDALGRRIQRTTSAGASERYVFDRRDVLLDLNADWSVATSYLSALGIDNHLRQTNSVTGVSYYLTDHLDSIAALADGAGNIVEQETYDSFGNSGGSTRTRYGYTGRERDPDSALLYYRARFYDAQAGRFISEDPIEFSGGRNWYVYANNNPIKFNDPEGLRVWVCSRLTYAPESWVGANHSYLFDDRKGGQSCGLSGPRKSRYPFYGSTEREKGPNEGATCRPVDGSDDPRKADDMMNCCRNYNATSYVPWVNDCHNLTHSCVTNAGLKDPGAPGARLGERCLKCSSPPPPPPKKIDWDRTPKCWGGARGC